MTKDYEVLSPGTYRFRVLRAERTLSSKGNDMMKLTLKVTKDDSSEAGQLVWDYLLNNDNPWTKHKIRAFCESVALPGVSIPISFESFAQENVVGLQGYVALKVEHSEQYGTKNAVKDYIVVKQEQPTQTTEEIWNEFVNADKIEDVPF
jgi:DNA-binding MurR/RpiR family transcriptional regulator